MATCRLLDASCLIGQLLGCHARSALGVSGSARRRSFLCCPEHDSVLRPQPALNDRTTFPPGRTQVRPEEIRTSLLYPPLPRVNGNAQSRPASMSLPSSSSTFSLSDIVLTPTTDCSRSRCLAKQPLAIGTLVLADEPTAAVLVDEERGKRCDQCLVALEGRPLRCARCLEVVYCSKDCKTISLPVAISAESC